MCFTVKIKLLTLVREATIHHVSSEISCIRLSKIQSHIYIYIELYLKDQVQAHVYFLW